MGGLISTVLQSDINEAGQLIQELAHTIQTGDWNSLLENDPFWRLAESARQSPKIISELCGFAESLLSESVSTASFLVKLIFPTLNGARTRLIVEILKLPLVYSILRLESFWMLVLHRKSFKEFFKENVYFSDLPAQLLALLQILRNPLFQKVLMDLGSEPSVLIQSFIEDARKLTSMLRMYGSPFPNANSAAQSLHEAGEFVPASGRVLGLLTWVTSDEVVRMLNDEALPTVLSLESAVKSLEAFRECMLEIESARSRYRSGDLKAGYKSKGERAEGTTSFVHEYTLLGCFCSEISRSLLKLISYPNIVSLLDFLKRHTPAVQGALLRLQEVLLAATLVPRNSMRNSNSAKSWSQCLANAWKSSELIVTTDPALSNDAEGNDEMDAEETICTESMIFQKKQNKNVPIEVSPHDPNSGLAEPILVSRLWVLQATIVFWLARWQVSDPTSLGKVVSELLSRDFWVEILTNFCNGCDEFAYSMQSEDFPMQGKDSQVPSILNATILALSGVRVRKLTQILHESAQIVIRAAESAVQLLSSLASHTKLESKELMNGCTLLRKALDSNGIDASQVVSVHEGLKSLRNAITEDDFRKFVMNVMTPALLQPIEKSLGGPETVKSLVEVYLSVGQSNEYVIGEMEKNNTRRRKKSAQSSFGIDCVWSKLSTVLTTKGKDEVALEGSLEAKFDSKEPVILQMKGVIKDVSSVTVLEESRFAHLVKLSNYTVRTFDLNEDLLRSVQSLLATLSGANQLSQSTSNEIDLSQMPPMYQSTGEENANAFLLENELIGSVTANINCASISVAELCSKWLLEPEVLAPLLAGQILTFCENEVLQDEQETNSIALHFALSDLLIRIANSHRLRKLISLGRDSYLPKIDAFWGTVCSEAFAELLEGIFPLIRACGDSEHSAERSDWVTNKISIDKGYSNQNSGVATELPFSEDAILASAVASPSLPSSLLDLSSGLVIRFFSVLWSTADIVDEILTPEFVQTLLELPLLHYAALAWTRGPTLPQENFSMFDALTFSESQFFRVLAVITLSCNEASEGLISKRKLKSPSSLVYKEFVDFFKLLIEKRRLFSLGALAYPSIFNAEIGFDGVPHSNPSRNENKGANIIDDSGIFAEKAAKLKSLDVGSILHACPRLSALVASTSFMRALAPEREILQGMRSEFKCKSTVKEDIATKCTTSHGSSSKSTSFTSESQSSTQNRVTALISLLRSLRFRFLSSLFRTIANDHRVFTKLLVYFGNDAGENTFFKHELKVGQTVSLKNEPGEFFISSKLVDALYTTRTQLLNIASAFLDLTVTLHLTQYRDIQGKANPDAVPHPFTLSEWPTQFTEEFKSQNSQSQVPLIFGDLDSAVAESRFLERFLQKHQQEHPPIRTVAIDRSSIFLQFAPLRNIDAHLNRSLTITYLTERSSFGLDDMPNTSLDIERSQQYNVAASDACLLVALLITSHPLIFISFRETSPLWGPLTDKMFYKKARSIWSGSQNLTLASTDVNLVSGSSDSDRSVVQAVSDRANKIVTSTAKYAITIRDQLRRTDSVRNGASQNAPEADREKVLNRRSAPTMFMLMIRLLQIASLSSIRSLMRDVGSEDSIWPHFIADAFRILLLLTKIPVECNELFLPSRVALMFMKQTGRSPLGIPSVIDASMGSILHWLIERSNETDHVTSSGVMRKFISPENALFLVVRTLRVCKILTEHVSERKSIYERLLCNPKAWKTFLNPYSLARLAAGSSLETLRKKFYSPTAFSSSQTATSLLDKLLRSKSDTIGGPPISARINRRINRVVERMLVRRLKPSTTPILHSNYSNEDDTSVEGEDNTVTLGSTSTSTFGVRGTHGHIQRGTKTPSERERLFSISSALFGRISLEEAMQELNAYFNNHIQGEHTATVLDTCYSEPTYKLTLESPL